jgi:hypothetical protein
MLSKKTGERSTGADPASTINFPPLWFLGTPSPLHDERAVSWVKFFTHALLDGDWAATVRANFQMPKK